MQPVLQDSQLFQSASSMHIFAIFGSVKCRQAPSCFPDYVFALQLKSEFMTRNYTKMTQKTTLLERFAVTPKPKYLSQCGATCENPRLYLQQFCYEVVKTRIISPAFLKLKINISKKPCRLQNSFFSYMKISKPSCNYPQFSLSIFIVLPDAQNIKHHARRQSSPRLPWQPATPMELCIKV